MDITPFSILLLSSFFTSVWSHARLMSPPSRSSMWRLGFATKKNFNDNALYCGGISIQWQKNGGKCGICGDPYNMPHPRDNEAGGKYGMGIISKTYRSGQVIEVSVDVTTNHRGYFEFKLCPNNNPKKEATQECLDKYLLKEAHGAGTRYYIGNKGNGDITVKLQLPKSLTCSQCVFQWTYVAGNNWGKCEDGASRLGCGPQETFRGCADIAIVKGTDVYDDKHNENDLDNKNHKEPHHKNKKHGNPKDTISTSVPSYSHDGTKNQRENKNKSHTNGNRYHFHNHNWFHTRHEEPSLVYSKVPVTNKHPDYNERRYYVGAGRRKHNKFDSRNFYYHLDHSSLQDSSSRGIHSEEGNLWFNKQGRDSYRKGMQPRFSTKKYPKGQNRPLAFVKMRNDSMMQGFNLGGRRYTDFWLL